MNYFDLALTGKVEILSSVIDQLEDFEILYNLNLVSPLKNYDKRKIMRVYDSTFVFLNEVSLRVIDDEPALAFTIFSGDESIYHNPVTYTVYLGFTVEGINFSHDGVIYNIEHGRAKEHYEFLKLKAI